MTLKEQLTYRIFPRLYLISFFWLCVGIFDWFMALPEPNNAQSAFVSVLAGGLVYAVKSYSDNGVKMKMNAENNHTTLYKAEIEHHVPKKRRKAPRSSGFDIETEISDEQ